MMNTFMLLYLVMLWIKKTFYSLPKRVTQTFMQWQVTKFHCWSELKSFIFFLWFVTKKRHKTFFSVNVKHAKIQTMARKHTHSDQVQKVVGLIINESSAIFLLQQNCPERVRFARYSKKSYFTRQRTILATRSN